MNIYRIFMGSDEQTVALALADNRARCLCVLIKVLFNPL